MLTKIAASTVRNFLQCQSGQLSHLRYLSAAGKDPNPGLAETKHGRKESDEDFDNRYIAWFSKPDIDSWELRKGIADLHGMDLIPEPKIIIAALEAARRLNDHSVAVRFLEALRWKSRSNKEIYPYLMQEIRPTLAKLGISTPEELGYDQPELSIHNAFTD
ncbi:PREDICTED: cytochrome c oxidase subunit 5A, mitochondrial-like [Rhagoletis zephyria]|uniref:cytochrome c oxidase subunit 5A, mitochondrial-like n=1 Tax=Rhagoletis zephyria TaxID=28612 RepID=UPI0008116396|nr:PREDICTED: cytochrome c oxidase subunit 5A, mitochondrial-like [Rhagoletis zephyria]